MSLQTMVSLSTGINNVLGIREKILTMFSWYKKEEKLNKLLDQEKNYDNKWKETIDIIEDFSKLWQLSSSPDILSACRKKMMFSIGDLTEELKILLMRSSFVPSEQKRIFKEYFISFVEKLPLLLKTINNKSLLSYINETQYNFTKSDSFFLMDYLKKLKQHDHEKDQAKEQILAVYNNLYSFQ